MPIEHNSFLPGGSLAHMFCNFVFMFLSMKLEVDIWFILKLQAVATANPGFTFCLTNYYARGFFVLLVKAGHEDCRSGKFSQYVRNQSKTFEACIVILDVGLKCNIPVFLAEDWLRPPLRS